MKKLVMLGLAASVALGGCTTYPYDNGYAATGVGIASPYGYYDRAYYDRYGRYDWNNPDPRYNGYYADRYYRSDPRYREYRLSANDRVYRGQDGRYYCRRSDGTTGLIVGGVGGALVGNVIDGGHNRAAGTLIGGALGALLGKTIDQNNSDIRCR